MISNLRTFSIIVRIIQGRKCFWLFFNTATTRRRLAPTINNPPKMSRIAKGKCSWSPDRWLQIQSLILFIQKIKIKLNIQQLILKENHPKNNLSNQQISAEIFFKFKRFQDFPSKKITNYIKKYHKLINKKSNNKNYHRAKNNHRMNKFYSE